MAKPTGQLISGEGLYPGREGLISGEGGAYNRGGRGLYPGRDGLISGEGGAYIRGGRGLYPGREGLITGILLRHLSPINAPYLIGLIDAPLKGCPKGLLRTFFSRILEQRGNSFTKRQENQLALLTAQ